MKTRAWESSRARQWLLSHDNELLPCHMATVLSQDTFDADTASFETDPSLFRVTYHFFIDHHWTAFGSLCNWRQRSFGARSFVFLQLLQLDFLDILPKLFISDIFGSILCLSISHSFTLANTLWYWSWVDTCCYLCIQTTLCAEVL